jgi:hypothetical protein
VVKGFDLMAKRLNNINADDNIKTMHVEDIAVGESRHRNKNTVGVRRETVMSKYQISASICGRKTPILGINGSACTEICL